MAVPVPRLSRRYESVHEYTDLPEITRQQIELLFGLRQSMGLAVFIELQAVLDVPHELVRRDKPRVFRRGL